MTQEEKAKAYDEAIERANELNYVSDKDSLQRKTVEHIFPKLKESEDDRIRKWLIGYLEYRVLNTSVIEEKENCNKAIAWLEKQGESNDISGQYKNDYWKNYVEQKPADDIERKYNPCYNMSFEEAQEYISNRGFDIPWTDCDVFVDFGYVTKTVANILRWADDNPKQKPAWSEEDGKIVEALNAYVKNLDMFFSEIKIGDKNIPSKEFREKVQLWLKSLKDRVQPKQEWSEEDDEHLERILKELENQYQRPINSPYLDKIESDYNWLKSLRPQSHWKPSEEQMEALNAINVTGCISYSGQGQKLINLYNDLKNLK